MSTITGVSSSTDTSYAVQLAQTSSLRRSLNNLGAAIQSGDLTTAGTTLAAIVKANPQYAASTSNASQSQDPINLDFQAVSAAIDNNDVTASRTAWTQLQTDLTKNGVSISDGTSATSKLLSDSKISINQQILTDAFGTSAASAGSLVSLLGGTTSTSDSSSVDALVSSWISYKAGGNATSTTVPGTTGGTLNTTA